MDKVCGYTIGEWCLFTEREREFIVRAHMETFNKQENLKLKQKRRKQNGLSIVVNS